jgi:hypothetical protein
MPAGDGPHAHVEVLGELLIRHPEGGLQSGCRPAAPRVDDVH